MARWDRAAAVELSAKAISSCPGACRKEVIDV